jgi:hypothetical protein
VSVSEPKKKTESIAILARLQRVDAPVERSIGSLGFGRVSHRDSNGKGCCCELRAPPKEVTQRRTVSSSISKNSKL